MAYKRTNIILFLILFGLCFVDMGPEFLTETSCSASSHESFLVAQAAGTKEKSSEQQKQKKSITAFYFHGNFRCSNCRKIEQYSREAIEMYFSEQLKTGELIFIVINTDQPENKHFVEDYQIYTRSLIIAEFKDGKQIKWKNLEKVWNYLNDQDKFYQYVKSEVQTYLEEM